ncbi:DNA polymerase subunit Cdc27 [Chaetomium strumarium]|uniref:DNA polymerase delta subunit 3 n=1 Tax=Chaetomium strumarium TaxID=1170767 RepID=A0AAJ0GW35_9PEZI|nr:DNA polymerase subunit Cdc27 [Chaetomium strumarium]
MDSYNKFLAENVLTEDKVVTYRLLSRALQVHVNTAKQMLYDFHRSQNAKRPGAVHATYLVYGTKIAAHGPPAAQNGSDGDVEMASSPRDAKMLTEAVPTSTLSLVPEERLKETLADYENVTSIHVYAVGPHPTKDMALLVDVGNELLTLDSQKSLVPITNPRMRRRERQGAGLKASTAAAAAAAAAKPPAKMAASKTLQAPAARKVKEEPQPAQPAQETTEKVSSSGPAKKVAPPLKRGASSGIMQAFSKAASKTTKNKKEAESRQLATPSVEDPAVQPLSDDGEDEEELPQPKPRSVSGLKSRKQREEELRKMMEEDDDDEEVSEREEIAEDEPMEEEPPAAGPVKEEETEVVTASTNGRRRGRRRVMRKKQIMDDQGYLVTIQEPGWESFSEDEPPPASKPKTTSSAPPRRRQSQRKAGRKGARAVSCPSFPRSSQGRCARQSGRLNTVIRGSTPPDGSVQAS